MTLPLDKKHTMAHSHNCLWDYSVSFLKNFMAAQWNVEADRGNLFQAVIGICDPPLMQDGPNQQGNHYVIR